MQKLLKKRWLWLSLFFVIIFGGALALLPLHDRITQANCNSIKKGMSLQEVEAILGGPPGDQTGWPHAFPKSYRFAAEAEFFWAGEEGMILVVLDKLTNGRVNFVAFIKAEKQYRSRPMRLWKVVQGWLWK
jgi:hypothetical protein